MSFPRVDDRAQNKINKSASFDDRISITSEKRSIDLKEPSRYNDSSTDNLYSNTAPSERKRSISPTYNTQNTSANTTADAKGSHIRNDSKNTYNNIRSSRDIAELRSSYYSSPSPRRPSLYTKNDQVLCYWYTSNSSDYGRPHHQLTPLMAIILSYNIDMSYTVEILSTKQRIDNVPESELSLVNSSDILHKKLTAESEEKESNRDNKANKVEYNIWNNVIMIAKSMNSTLSTHIPAALLDPESLKKEHKVRVYIHDSNSSSIYINMYIYLSIYVYILIYIFILMYIYMHNTVLVYILVIWLYRALYTRHNTLYIC